MTRYFPTTHSTLSVKALLSEVLQGYDLPTITALKFLNIGLNDTYVARAEDDQKYILRIYRTPWRTLPEVSYEIDALNHLHRRGVAIARPILRKDGKFTCALSAIEGTRYAVLFTYAPGRPIAYEEEDKGKMFHYGKLVATIHSSTQDFSSVHNRFSIDLEHLLDAPLRSIAPMLAHRKGDWHYLQQIADTIRHRFAALPSNDLEEGFCHGDFHPGNVHFVNDETAMVFDFDGCGWGWRAYDVAVFRWSARLREKETLCWEPFLRGYQAVRAIADVDLRAIPLFIGIRHFFLLGVHTGNGQDWGFGWMNEKYFDEAIAFFKAWEAEHLR